MKQLLNFVQKEFLHMLRDSRTLLIIMAMPAVQMLIFGYAITTEINNIPFAVYDQTHSEISRQLIHNFNSSKYFSLYQQSNASTSPADIASYFKAGKIKMAIIIPADLDYKMAQNEAKIQFLIDASDPNEGTNINNYASQVLLKHQVIKHQIEQKGIQLEIKMLYNPQLKAAYNFVPGIMGLILMLICAMMTSVAIVREKEQGTMEILLVSPFNSVYVIIAKAIPFFCIAMLDVCMILIMSYYIFQVPIVGSIVLIFVLAILFTLASLSIGILVSTIVDSQQAAMLVSGAGLMIPTIMLSGLLFPIENMPLILQLMSNILPAKWFIIAIKDVMIKGLGIQAILIPCLVMASMIIVLLGVSIKKFKTRL